MKNMNSKKVLLAGFVVLIGASCALAQDWPQWRGPNRDAKVTGFTVPQTWPKELTQKWKVTVGQGNSTPALVGDKLYVITRQDANEVILCLDAATGKELWRDEYGAIVVTGGPSKQHSGPRSTPTVANGKVVTLGVGGILSCFDAASGKMLWRKNDFPGEWPQFYTATSPIVVDGLCIAHLGGKDSGAIVAYDLASGEQKWKWTGEGPTYSSPVLMTVNGTKQLVVHTEKILYGISAADGKLLWQVVTPTKKMFYSSATPIIDGQTVIYTGQGSGTKAIKIEKQGDSFVTKELWSNEELGTGFNTPVLKNGLLFGLTEKGILFCINAQTGTKVWTDETTKRDRFGSILDAGSVLLGLTPQSQLFVFEPSNKEYKELASFKVADTQTYAHPVVAGNRIFIKDQDSVILWTID